jgi:hypothetical protein
MATMTRDTAIDRLMHIPQAKLYEICFYGHKDQYGTKGYHMSKYTVPELVSWFILHYNFNEAAQTWETIIPFEPLEDPFHPRLTGD